MRKLNLRELNAENCVERLTQRFPGKNLLRKNQQQKTLAEAKSGSERRKWPTKLGSGQRRGGGRKCTVCMCVAHFERLAGPRSCQSIGVSSFLGLALPSPKISSRRWFVVEPVVLIVRDGVLQIAFDSHMPCCS